MGYLDRIAVPSSAHGRFPWEIAAAERPELVTLVRVLIAHGLLATGEAACPACLRCAHSRTPPLLAVELRSLRERAAAGKRQP